MKNFRIIFFSILISVSLCACSRIQAQSVSNPPVSTDAAETDPVDFLLMHVDLEEELGSDNFAFMTTEVKLPDSSEDVYRISIGKNTEEKFTDELTYYVSKDFSKIIQANPLGKNIMIWKEES